MSQDALEAAVKLVAAAVLNRTDLPPNPAPPSVCPNISDEGEAVMALVALALTAKVTGMVSVVPPPVTVTDPW